MALDTNATKLTNLFDPEVIGDFLDKKLFDAIKFAPLARVDYRLEGSAGSKIKLPYYTSIGNATTVAEGADIPIAQLTETTVPVTITKAGRGVQLTDEAILNSYGDAIGEATSQLAAAIASKVDEDLLTNLNGNTTNVYTCTGSSFVADDVADALVKFGEDIDGEKVILVSPETYAIVRKADDWIPASEVSAQAVIGGVVGMIHGCQVVVTNRIKASAKVAHIVKPNALAIYLKRDTLVETDRDIVNSSNVIVATKHYATYLQDASKAIKIVLP